MIFSFSFDGVANRTAWVEMRVRLCGFLTVGGECVRVLVHSFGVFYTFTHFFIQLVPVLYYSVDLSYCHSCKKSIRHFGRCVFIMTKFRSYIFASDLVKSFVLDRWVTGAFEDPRKSPFFVPAARFPLTLPKCIIDEASPVAHLVSAAEQPGHDRKTSTSKLELLVHARLKTIPLICGSTQ